MKGIALFLATLAFVTAAAAQVYPTRTITLVVPLVAGSSADILARTIGAELGKRLGQSVVIDNRPGAGGTIAMQQVAKAAPDGYTLVLISNASLAINLALYPNAGYDARDFVPIALVGDVSNVMIVHPTHPAKNAQDVIAQARAKPGESTYSSGGNGTTHHLSGVLFSSMAGIDTVHVPYKGAPQGIVAVMSKEVTMGFFNTPTVIAQVRDGRLKPLAVTSSARSQFLPDVPTLDEAGLKGYEVTAWFGLGGPAKMPASIVDRLHDEMLKIMADPAVRDRLIAQGFELRAPMSIADVRKQVQAEQDKWTPIIRKAGAKVD